MYGGKTHKGRAIWCGDSLNGTTSNGKKNLGKWKDQQEDQKRKNVLGFWKWRQFAWFLETQFWRRKKGAAGRVGGNGGIGGKILLWPGFQRQKRKRGLGGGEKKNRKNNGEGKKRGED